MPDPSAESPLEQAVELLVRHGVEFIVVRGQAEILHGGGRVTFDIDICNRRTEENLERLAAAMCKIKPTLRGAPSDLPFDIHARTIAFGLNFTLQTTFGGFDLLGEVEPIGSFEDVMKNAEEFEFGPWRLWVIGLDDLLRVKEFINRPKDLQSLYELRALKRLRDEKGLR